MSYFITGEHLQELCNVTLTAFYEGVKETLESLKIEREAVTNPLDLYDTLDDHFHELYIRLKDHSVEESFKKAKQAIEGAVHEER